jgi:hypothetical protein
MSDQDEDLRLAGPTIFDSGIFDKICDLISHGYTLRRACLAIKETDGFSITPVGVRYWVTYEPTCAARYARARNAHLDNMEEEILDIADDMRNDIVRDRDGNPVIDGRGNPLVNHEYVQRTRLRVETRKWMLSKLRPQVYGDNVNINQTITNKTVPVTEEELSKLQDDWLNEASKSTPKALN